MSRQTTLAGLLESFFRERLVDQCNASSATVQSYRDTFRLLLLFSSGHLRKHPDAIEIRDLGRETILRFLNHLENERGNSVGTRNTRLIAIRSFFLHVAYSDPASLAVCKGVLDIQMKRAVHRALVFLTRKQLAKLLDVPDRSTAHGRRHHALMLFMAKTGARVSETINVNVSDVRFENPPHVLLHGKGSKDRLVPLTREVTRRLQDICVERGLVGTENLPLFVNRKGMRFTRYGVVHIVRRCAELAAHGDKTIARVRVTPHTLRHTAAMHLLQSRVDLATIQSWLGHSSINTTHTYVEADLEMKRAALDKCGIQRERRRTYPPTPRILRLLEDI